MQRLKPAITVPFLLCILMMMVPAAAQEAGKTGYSLLATGPWWRGLMLALAVAMLAVAALMVLKVIELRNSSNQRSGADEKERYQEHLRRLTSKQIDAVLQYKKKQGNHTGVMRLLITCLITATLALSGSHQLMAQAPVSSEPSSLLGEGGIIITIILVSIPVLATLILLTVRLSNMAKRYRRRAQLKEAAAFADYLKSLPDEVVENVLKKRKAALDYSLSQQELSGTQQPDDARGLLQIKGEPGLPVVAAKKKALPRPHIDPRLSRLVLWYLGTATWWLLFGTTVGEYVGIKFLAPDADHLPWLSFGRLRPVHTNAVFWGWASLAMLGLGYYIVPRVSNVKLASIRMGWYALYCINASVVIGTICLMAGINNGGGEYREYTWPVMLLFGIGLALTLINYWKTIAARATKQIYISNWYIVSAVIFTIVIALAAYLPYWQNGLGETIIQGYYMHQGVGMWFMLFTLGIVYYFLPQQLNKPIYSYSLGILAFWTQILFYTLIGSHHFVFSSIPWWLQTVAIVGSMGMAIPVIAGTTNFLMTFKGAWYKVRDSYTLPFFLVGIIFYFTGSMQGSAEAFRFTNLVWHFTDFTVAHSHLTMYGIISFLLWACTYAVLPRLTGREAPHWSIGAHFWMALVGLLFYSVPLMIGGTLKGLAWMQGKPFIESVELMGPYWLWRAIGGSLMWLSHIFFAYNMYKMIARKEAIDVRETAILQLQKAATLHPEPIA